MRQVDFYFHDGCLSQRSILLLAREIETTYPTWTVIVHPLLEDEVKSLGLQVLPTVTINGVRVASGMPSKEWLLETIRVCDQ
jgi:hypothetical protein